MNLVVLKHNNMGSSFEALVKMNLAVYTCTVVIQMAESNAMKSTTMVVGPTVTTSS